MLSKSLSRVVTFASIELTSLWIESTLRLMSLWSAETFSDISLSALLIFSSALWLILFAIDSAPATALSSFAFTSRRVESSVFLIFPCLSSNSFCIAETRVPTSFCSSLILSFTVLFRFATFVFKASFRVLNSSVLRFERVSSFDVMSSETVLNFSLMSLNFVSMSLERFVTLSVMEDDSETTFESKLSWISLIFEFISSEM